MKSAVTFCIAVFLLCIALTESIAQETGKFGFSFWLDLPVSVNNDLLENPWTGGINNAQFGKIDLNNDGNQDLVVFDRHGDRLLTFLFESVSAYNGYKYHPEYRRYFPQIQHWMQLVDYNGDGRPDLFTYTPGGIMVYKNEGENTPVFEKAVDPYITSLQGSIFTNLLVTYVDYPAIADLDGDGDLDILTFWGLGSYVDLHRNMSVELYGNTDSLIYHKVEGCWGQFAENPESNIIYLDTCYQKKSVASKNIISDPKHTGSTFCLIDINGDGIRDLLLGDVDYSEPAVLINGGSDFDALMTEQLPAFPQTDPINIWSFPLTQLIDTDNSGKDDLMVSPFDPSLTKGAGLNNIWHYKNISETSEPDYRLMSTSFLQNTMLDMGMGAYPVLFDVNGDGLTDLVTGNYGKLDSCNMNQNGQLKCYYTSSLSLFLNNGTTTEPSFYLADDDFAGTSSLFLKGLYPAFGDLNGDGRPDMLLGNENGDFIYYQNISSGADGVPVYAAPQLSYQGLDAGAYSTPVLVKLPGESLPALVSGNAEGKLCYFKNSGTFTSPVFSLVTDFFGKVNVTDTQVSYTGYSVPCFVQSNDGEFLLLVGSESGRLFLFGDVSTLPDASFTVLSNHFLYISEGIRTSPAVGDLNGDTFPDMALGNYSGGVVMLKGQIPGPSGGESSNFDQNRVKIIPNPNDGVFVIEMGKIAGWVVRLTDLQGRMVKKIKASETHRIIFDSGRPEAGLYFITVQETGSNSRPETVKVMITR